jgi:hypothetical protein
MGEVIRFVPKSERERDRLIREARAIYDSIFPADPVDSGAKASSGLSNAKRPVLIPAQMAEIDSCFARFDLSWIIPSR